MQPKGRRKETERKLRNNNRWHWCQWNRGRSNEPMLRVTVNRLKHHSIARTQEPCGLVRLRCLCQDSTSSIDMSIVKTLVNVKIIARKLFLRSSRPTSCRDIYSSLFFILANFQQRFVNDLTKFNSNSEQIFRVNFVATRVNTCNAIDQRRHLQFTYAECEQKKKLISWKSIFRFRSLDCSDGDASCFPIPSIRCNYITAAALSNCHANNSCESKQNDLYAFFENTSQIIDSKCHRKTSVSVRTKSRLCVLCELLPFVVSPGFVPSLFLNAINCNAPLLRSCDGIL